MKICGIQDEWRTFYSKKDRRVVDNFDWFFWVDIFKPKKADIVPNLLINFNSDEGFSMSAAKECLLALKRWIIVINDLRRQGPVCKESFKKTWPALQIQLEWVSFPSLDVKRGGGWDNEHHSYSRNLHWHEQFAHNLCRFGQQRYWHKTSKDHVLIFACCRRQWARSKFKGREREVSGYESVAK